MPSGFSCPGNVESTSCDLELGETPVQPPGLRLFVPAPDLAVRKPAHHLLEQVLDGDRVSRAILRPDDHGLEQGEAPTATGMAGAGDGDDVLGDAHSLRRSRGTTGSARPRAAGKCCVLGAMALSPHRKQPPEFSGRFHVRCPGSTG